MNKNIIGVAALGLLVFATKKKTPPAPPTNTTAHDSQQNTAIPDSSYSDAGTTTIQPTGGSPGAPIPTINSLPFDKGTWKRNDWAVFFQNKIKAVGLEQALRETWDEWTSESNSNRAYISTPQSLLISLGAYIPQNHVGTGFVINWDSTPIYANWSNWWSDVPVWDCTHWKEWHQKLEAHYRNTTRANQVWENAWNSSEWGWAWFDCISQNCNFIEYMWGKGINVSVGVWRWGDSTVCNLRDFGANVVLAASNTAAAASTISKNAPIVLLGLVGIWTANKLGYIGKGGKK